MFILSAGWGLISANYLTPDYDITFSANADPYIRRGNQDKKYQDFNQLPDSDEPLVFLGGASYQQFFLRLTAGYRGTRIVCYNSGKPPQVDGCMLCRYETRTRTNWHYQCAMDLIAGRLHLPL
ncbi:hypothetical protein [Candidatus Symbiobacter mobilis]|uniref:hypothetical protein n=1 Tax=Candidatus Symbiobacter mobilis TaxID=1436290 RepID=UPI001930DACF|nr:hypothetical protein [Candidatus Symbiobacter mobilis]